MPASDQSNLDQKGFLLGRAYYSSIGLLQARLNDPGLSARAKPGIGSLLFAQFREERRRMTDIAAELQIADSTLSAMVLGTHEAGFITLEPDESDGRSWRLRLMVQARGLSLVASNGQTRRRNCLARN